jgi:ABC-type nitrate/sulfonate/bicarbonate transport system substrate-binding protein
MESPDGAQRQGYFDAQGVAVSFPHPQLGIVSSLLEGKADLALATIDNLVAYQEGGRGEDPGQS